ARPSRPLLYHLARAGSSVDGQEHFSAYVARDGRMISGSCVAGESVVARPWSNNETADALHPPNGPGSREADGFELVFAEVRGKEMRVNFTKSLRVTVGGPVAWYHTWIRTMEGGLEGERT
ncbi:hypothetical protein LTR49_028811, partial [Elasticomyces elasticus]